MSFATLIEKDTIINFDKEKFEQIFPGIRFVQKYEKVFHIDFDGSYVTGELLPSVDMFFDEKVDFYVCEVSEDSDMPFEIAAKEGERSFNLSASLFPDLGVAGKEVRIFLKMMGYSETFIDTVFDNSKGEEI